MGVVTEIGSKVKKFKVGDKVGITGIIDTCGKCDRCKEGLENYCPNFISADGTSFADNNPNNTAEEIKIYGAFSNITIIQENFVIRWPENYPLAAGVPLLCAGSTSYGPMKYLGFDKPGMHIGVVGFGGIGKLAVKFGKAFGAKVTVISTSIDKKQEAVERYGADGFLLSNQPEELQVI